MREAISGWMDAVAELAAAVLSLMASPPTVRLVEEANGEFVVESKNMGRAGRPSEMIRIVAGQIDRTTAAVPVAATLADSQVDLILRPDRFLFRPLELPNRANEFLPGIVRSQIDRLTPWNAADTAFGWSAPTQADPERIVVTVAASSLNLIKPYAQAVTDIGAHSVAVFTHLPDLASSMTPIKVWEQKGRGANQTTRIRRALVTTLAACAMLAGIAVALDSILGASLWSQKDKLASQISGIRSAGTLTTARLERRKNDTSPTVMVLEALSKILPDETYVTELHFEGDKVRLTGISRDAPSLIGLIERSGRFTRAAFFAPTTRSELNTNDRFHIEAVIRPLGPSS